MGKTLEQHCIADLAQVFNSVEREKITASARRIGEYLLAHKPISIEQVCVGIKAEKKEVNGVMARHRWYSGLPQPSRNPAIDDLVEQGVPTLQEIGQRMPHLLHRSSVLHYLKTRGLYEYWQMKAGQFGHPPPRQKKINYPSLHDPAARKLLPYDPARIYR